MNVMEKVKELHRQSTGEEITINEVLLTIITRYQLFEPCRYLGEDEEWINVEMLSIENEDISQAMSIRKSEMVMFGIYNHEEVEIPMPQTDPEAFYQ